MQIEIVNWDKYNPRTDAKAWSWFRLQNDFLEDDEFFDLTQSDLLLFIYLCSRRSKGAKAVFGISLRKAAMACRCEPNDVLVSLEALERLTKVIIHEWKPDTNADVRSRTHTYADVRAGECIRSVSPQEAYPTLRYDTDVTNGTVRNTGEGVEPPPSQAIVRIEPVEAQYEEPPPKVPKKPKAPSDGAQVWQAYAHAYQTRYGSEPIRNARVNGQCSQLVARLGAERAIAVVRFYLTHQSRYYVQTAHSLGACLKDSEALWTQMQTGQRITSTTAGEADKGQANEDVFKRLARKWDAEEEREKTNEGDHP